MGQMGQKYLRLFRLFRLCCKLPYSSYLDFFDMLYAYEGLTEERYQMGQKRLRLSQKFQMCSYLAFSVSHLKLLLF
jgi:hypothetical protein